MCFIFLNYIALNLLLHTINKQAMYKSKYANLMQNLMNEHDLILLDSEQQEIENWVDKDLKAINYSPCCKSESEQLKIPKTTKEQRAQLNEGYNKK